MASFSGDHIKLQVKQAAIWLLWSYSMNQIEAAFAYGVITMLSDPSVRKSCIYMWPLLIHAGVHVGSLNWVLKLHDTFLILKVEKDMLESQLRKSQASISSLQAQNQRNREKATKAEGRYQHLHTSVCTPFLGLKRNQMCCMLSIWSVRGQCQWEYWCCTLQCGVP